MLFDNMVDFCCWVKNLLCVRTDNSLCTWYYNNQLSTWLGLMGLRCWHFVDRQLVCGQRLKFLILIIMPTDTSFLDCLGAKLYRFWLQFSDDERKLFVWNLHWHLITKNCFSTDDDRREGNFRAALSVVIRVASGHYDDCGNNCWLDNGTKKQLTNRCRATIVINVTHTLGQSWAPNFSATPKLDGPHPYTILTPKSRQKFDIVLASDILALGRDWLEGRYIVWADSFVMKGPDRSIEGPHGYCTIMKKKPLIIKAVFADDESQIDLYISSQKPRVQPLFFFFFSSTALKSDIFRTVCVNRKQGFTFNM